MTPVRRRRAGRVVARALWLLATLVTTMLIALTIAMFRTDAAIDAAPLRATGTVLSVGPLRTGIEFVDGQGHAVRPASGVLYPGLLNVGQQFLVEYASADPDLVRVAGRSARTVLPWVGLWLAGTWLVTGSLIAWSGRGSSRLGRAKAVVG